MIPTATPLVPRTSSPTGRISSRESGRTELMARLISSSMLSTIHLGQMGTSLIVLCTRLGTSARTSLCEFSFYGWLTKLHHVDSVGVWRIRAWRVTNSSCVRCRRPRSTGKYFETCTSLHAEYEPSHSPTNLNRWYTKTEKDESEIFKAIY